MTPERRAHVPVSTKGDRLGRLRPCGDRARACGSSNDNGGGVNSGAPVRARRGHAEGPRDRRLRAHRPGQVYYQFDYVMTLRDAAAAVLVQAGRVRDADAGSRRLRRPRSRTAARRSRSSSSPNISSARRSTARPRRRTSSTRSSAASPPTVANGYVGTYFGDIEGAPVRPQDGADISGHRDARRPDDRVQARPPVGGLPRRRARAADHGARARRSTPRSTTRRRPVDLRQQPGVHRPIHGSRTTARQDHLQAGKSSTLVRNPNWDPSRPTTGPRTSTRSRSTRATRPTSRRARSSTART